MAQGHSCTEPKNVLLLTHPSGVFHVLAGPAAGLEACEASGLLLREACLSGEASLPPMRYLASLFLCAIDGCLNPPVWIFKVLPLLPSSESYLYQPREEDSF